MTNGMCSDFKELIEYAYEKNSRPVVLVGHSLGCAFIYEFLTRYVTTDWKSTYIKEIILAGAPLGGSLEALAHLYTPHSWKGIPGKYVHPVAVTLGGMHWMIPNYNAYNDSSALATITIDDNDPITLTVANMSYAFNLTNNTTI